MANAGAYTPRQTPVYDQATAMQIAKAEMYSAAEEAFAITRAAGITNVQATAEFNQIITDVASEGATSVTNIGAQHGDTVMLTDGTVGTLE